MIYNSSDYNPDDLPGIFTGGSQTGNQRFVVQTEEGFRRFIRYANGHSGKGRKIFMGDIGFPVVPTSELRSERKVNAQAVKQGIISQADYDYFYVKS